MSTSIRSVTLVSLLGLFLSIASHGGAEALEAQRWEAGVLLQLGRPAADEAAPRGLVSVEAAMRAAAGMDAREAVARRAWKDAFGAELPARAPAGRGGYASQLEGHRLVLADDGQLYREVIDRAYRFVIQRGAYEEEFAYWEERPTLPYLLLVGCIEDWARRNQPGLMVTAGEPAVSVNCEYLATRRLSPEVAAEAQAALGVTDDGAKVQVLAPGGEAVVSVGGIHFIAVGGPSLR